jgi:hypothetical protein
MHRQFILPVAAERKVNLLAVSGNAKPLHFLNCIGIQSVKYPG